MPVDTIERSPAFFSDRRTNGLNAGSDYFAVGKRSFLRYTIP